MFQLAYFQMVGAGKARNQDALFDGTAVRQVRLHKTRVSEADGLCRICNVGDSRVYHISAEGRWRQVSHDHTVLADLIEQGEARADTEYADMYYALAHCLIADDEETHFKIFTDSFTLQRGEAVLVCSDGLHDALSHERLEALWNASPSLLDKLEALRRSVKRVPYHDDCSVAVCLRQG